MRRMWDNKKFFSFYEHLEPSQVRMLIDGGTIQMKMMERRVGLGGFVPYIAFMIRPHPANEETVMNNIIGIA